MKTTATVMVQVEVRLDQPWHEHEKLEDVFARCRREARERIAHAIQETPGLFFRGAKVTAIMVPEREDEG